MKPQFRVALVSAFPPGQQSLNEYGFHLAMGLAEHPDVAEVVVIADKILKPFKELDLGPKITIKRVWRFNSLFSAFGILAVLKREQVDAALWNLQTATFGDREVAAAAGLLAPAASRAFGIVSGVIAHNIVGSIDLEKTKLKGQRIRQAVVRCGGSVVSRALLAANYTTVTLRAYHELLTATNPNANLHLVPHGTFDVVQSIPTPILSRPSRIVAMGKFGTYKRLETLLEAFDILRMSPEFSELELVIGGTDHPNAPGYLRRTAKSRTADPGVRFHGYVLEEDVATFFGDAKLSVFDYSATTGSSGVLHQTAGYGAVPIFPKIGDFVDVCRDEGLSGENYMALDSSDMARAMAKILLDPQLAQSIADSNYLAAQDMPFSKVIDTHVNLLRQQSAQFDKSKAAAV